MTWTPSPPIEALCTVCGVRHGSPMCAPVRRPLADHPLCKHGERDYDELPHSVRNDVTRAWDYCPAVAVGRPPVDADAKRRSVGFSVAPSTVPLIKAIMAVTDDRSQGAVIDRIVCEAVKR